MAGLALLLEPAGSGWANHGSRICVATAAASARVPSTACVRGNVACAALSIARTGRGLAMLLVPGASRAPPLSLHVVTAVSLPPIAVRILQRPCLLTT